jgi:hypothetical protein
MKATLWAQTFYIFQQQKPSISWWDSQASCLCSDLAQNTTLQIT